MSLPSKGLLNGLLVVITLFSVVRCSDAPEQYPPAAAQYPAVVIPNPSDIKPLIIKGKPSDDDKLARDNSSQPIIFKRVKSGDGFKTIKGAAGITLDSTLKDASKKLAEPFYGPGQNGLTGYREGIIVPWRMKAPQIPQAIYVSNEYLGPFEVGGEIGTLTMRTELRKTKWFNGPPTSETYGHSFAQELYRQLELGGDPKAKDFDCIKLRMCQLIRAPEFIVVYWPSFGMLITNDDRMAIAEIRLLRSVPLFNLQSELDVAKGEMELKSGKTLAINTDTWNSAAEKIFAGVPETLQVHPIAEMVPNYIYEQFSGVTISLDRNKFGRDYIREEGMEIVKGIEVGTGFLRMLKVNGKYVEVVTTKPGPENLEKGTGDIELKLVEKDKRVQGKQYLSLHPQIPAALRINFTNKLRDLIKTELDKLWPDSKTIDFENASGVFKDAPNKRNFAVNLAKYNPATGKGSIISYTVREEKGDIQSLSVGALDLPIDKTIIPALAAPFVAAQPNVEGEIDPTSRKLAGFQLGQEVKITDIDQGRGEATLLVNVRGTATATRITHVPDGLFVGSFTDGRKHDEIQIVTVGDFSVKLGLKAAEDAKFASDGKTLPLQIVSITTGYQTGPISNLCGMADFAPKIGDRDINVEAALLKAKDIEKCPHDFDRYSDGNDHQLKTIYFTRDQVKINFTDRQLSEVSIYANPSEER